MCLLRSCGFGTLLLVSALCTVLASAQSGSSPRRECTSEELKLSASDGPDGGLGHYSYVFAVTNSSQQTCTLSGVPRIRLVDEHDRDLKISTCANCQDYMFDARPSGVVLLRPGESAHLLVGVFIIDAPGHHCVIPSRLDVFAGINQKPLAFKFGHPACDKINESAWRAGIYKKP
jgi:hypothetical protein